MPDLASRTVLEPFCGGCSVTAARAPLCAKVLASDANVAVISLWRAATHQGARFDGWDVTEEIYSEARSWPDTDPRKAFVLVGCAFGGKWNGGFARNAAGYDYPRAAARGIARKSTIMASHGVAFAAQSYIDAPRTPGRVVYCDPPYAGTTGYGGVDPFDSAAFWADCEHRARNGQTVFVSEYSAPSGWVSVLDLERTQHVRGDQTAKASDKDRRIERLYAWAG